MLHRLASGDAVVLLDPERRVRWFNHAAENLLGLRAPRDRGAMLEQRLQASELGDWLRQDEREPLQLVSWAKALQEKP